MNFASFLGYGVIFSFKSLPQVYILNDFNWNKLRIGTGRSLHKLTQNLFPLVWLLGKLMSSYVVLNWALQIVAKLLKWINPIIWEHPRQIWIQIWIYPLLYRAVLLPINYYIPNSVVVLVNYLLHVIVLNVESFG